MTLRELTEGDCLDSNRHFHIFDLLIFMLGIAICFAISQWWGTQAVLTSLAVGLFTSICSINFGRYRVWTTNIESLARLVSAFQVAFAMTIITLVLLILIMIFFAGRRLSFDVVCWSILKVNLFSHAFGIGFPTLGKSLVKLNRIFVHLIFGRT